MPPRGGAIASSRKRVSMRDLSSTSHHQSTRHMLQMRELSMKKNLDNSMKDNNPSSHLGGSMPDMKSHGASTRRLISDAELHALQSSFSSPKWTIGQKLLPDSQGDGIFCMQDEQSDDKSKWPKMPFFFGGSKNKGMDESNTSTNNSSRRRR